LSEAVIRSPIRQQGPMAHEGLLAVSGSSTPRVR
jgi:hypothetical protein